MYYYYDNIYYVGDRAGRAPGNHPLVRPANTKPAQRATYEGEVRETAKSYFFSGPATKALPPPPRAHFLGIFFLELQRRFFYLSGQAP